MIPRYIHLLYATALTLLMVFSFKEWWAWILVPGLVWIGSAILAIRNNSLSIRVARLILCAILAFGILEIFAFSYLLIQGGLDRPMSEVSGLVFSQVALTLPAFALLLSKWKKKEVAQSA